MRFLDAAANAHARAHNPGEDGGHEKETSKPTHCVDDTAWGKAQINPDHGHVDPHPWESEVAVMMSSCHRVRGAASPDEGGVVEMVIDCHLAPVGCISCYDSSPIYTYFLTLLTCDAPPESPYSSGPPTGPLEPMDRLMPNPYPN